MIPECLSERDLQFCCHSCKKPGCNDFGSVYIRIPTTQLKRFCDPFTALELCVYSTKFGILESKSTQIHSVNDKYVTFRVDCATGNQQAETRLDLQLTFKVTKTIQSDSLKLKAGGEVCVVGVGMSTFASVCVNLAICSRNAIPAVNDDSGAAELYFGECKVSKLDFVDLHAPGRSFCVFCQFIYRTAADNADVSNMVNQDSLLSDDDFGMTLLDMKRVNTEPIHIDVVVVDYVSNHAATTESLVCHLKIDEQTSLDDRAEYPPKEICPLNKIQHKDSNSTAVKQLHRITLPESISDSLNAQYVSNACALSLPRLAIVFSVLSSSSELIAFGQISPQSNLASAVLNGQYDVTLSSVEASNGKSVSREYGVLKVNFTTTSRNYFIRQSGIPFEIIDLANRDVSNGGFSDDEIYHFFSDYLSSGVMEDSNPESYIDIMATNFLRLVQPCDVLQFVHQVFRRLSAVHEISNAKSRKMKKKQSLAVHDIAKFVRQLVKSVIGKILSSDSQQQSVDVILDAVFCSFSASFVCHLIDELGDDVVCRSILVASFLKNSKDSDTRITMGLEAEKIFVWWIERLESQKKPCSLLDEFAEKSMRHLFPHVVGLVPLDVLGNYIGLIIVLSVKDISMSFPRNAVLEFANLVKMLNHPSQLGVICPVLSAFCGFVLSKALSKNVWKIDEMDIILVSEFVHSFCKNVLGCQDTAADLDGPFLNPFESVVFQPGGIVSSDWTAGSRGHGHSSSPRSSPQKRSPAATPESFSSFMAGVSSFSVIDDARRSSMVINSLGLSSVESKAGNQTSISTPKLKKEVSSPSSHRVKFSNSVPQDEETKKEKKELHGPFSDCEFFSGLTFLDLSNYIIDFLDLVADLSSKAGTKCSSGSRGLMNSSSLLFSSVSILNQSLVGYIHFCCAANCTMEKDEAMTQVQELLQVVSSAISAKWRLKSLCFRDMMESDDNYSIKRERHCWLSSMSNCLLTDSKSWSFVSDLWTNMTADIGNVKAIIGHCINNPTVLFAGTLESLFNNSTANRMGNVDSGNFDAELAAQNISSSFQCCIKSLMCMSDILKMFHSQTGLARNKSFAAFATANKLSDAAQTQLTAALADACLSLMSVFSTVPSSVRDLEMSDDLVVGDGNRVDAFHVLVQFTLLIIFSNYCYVGSASQVKQAKKFEIPDNKDYASALSPYTTSLCFRTLQSFIGKASDDHSWLVEHALVIAENVSKNESLSRSLVKSLLQCYATIANSLLFWKRFHLFIAQHGDSERMEKESSLAEFLILLLSKIAFQFKLTMCNMSEVMTLSCLAYNNLDAAQFTALFPSVCDLSSHCLHFCDHISPDRHGSKKNFCPFSIGFSRLFINQMSQLQDTSYLDSAVSEADYSQIHVQINDAHKLEAVCWRNAVSSSKICSLGSWILSWRCGNRVLNLFHNGISSRINTLIEIAVAWKRFIKGGNVSRMDDPKLECAHIGIAANIKNLSLMRHCDVFERNYVGIQLTEDSSAIDNRNLLKIVSSCMSSTDLTLCKAGAECGPTEIAGFVSHLSTLVASNGPSKNLLLPFALWLLYASQQGMILPQATSEENSTGVASLLELHHQIGRITLQLLLEHGYFEVSQRICAELPALYDLCLAKSGSSSQTQSATFTKASESRLKSLKSELSRTQEVVTERISTRSNRRVLPLFYAVYFSESPWSGKVSETDDSQSGGSSSSASQSFWQENVEMKRDESRVEEKKAPEKRIEFSMNVGSRWMIFRVDSNDLVDARLFDLIQNSPSLQQKQSGISSPALQVAAMLSTIPKGRLAKYPPNSRASPTSFCEKLQAWFPEFSLLPPGTAIPPPLFLGQSGKPYMAINMCIPEVCLSLETLEKNCMNRQLLLSKVSDLHDVARRLTSKQITPIQALSATSPPEVRPEIKSVVSTPPSSKSALNSEKSKKRGLGLRGMIGKKDAKDDVGDIQVEEPIVFHSQLQVSPSIDMTVDVDDGPKPVIVKYSLEDDQWNSVRSRASQSALLSSFIDSQSISCLVGIANGKPSLEESEESSVRVNQHSSGLTLQSPPRSKRQQPFQTPPSSLDSSITTTPGRTPFSVSKAATSSAKHSAAKTLKPSSNSNVPFGVSDDTSALYEDIARQMSDCVASLDWNTLNESTRFVVFTRSSEDVEHGVVSCVRLHLAGIDWAELLLFNDDCNLKSQVYSSNKEAGSQTELKWHGRGAGSRRQLDGWAGSAISNFSIAVAVEARDVDAGFASTVFLGYFYSLLHNSLSILQASCEASSFEGVNLGSILFRNSGKPKSAVDNQSSSLVLGQDSASCLLSSFGCLSLILEVLSTADCFSAVGLNFSESLVVDCKDKLQEDWRQERKKIKQQYLRQKEEAKELGNPVPPEPDFASLESSFRPSIWVNQTEIAARALDHLLVNSMAILRNVTDNVSNEEAKALESIFGQAASTRWKQLLLWLECRLVLNER